MTQRVRVVLVAVSAIVASFMVVAGRQPVFASPVFASSVPGAPAAVSGVPGSGRVTLQWTAPSSDGGSPVTAYVVTPILGGVAQTPRTYNSAATTQVVPSLMNGKAYTFQVAAKNAVGTGPQSGASPTVLVGRPTAPTNLVAAAGSGRATVSWTAPATNGGAVISGYIVTPYQAGVAQSPHTFASTQLSETVTGLTNNARYTFKAAAKNANGTGLPSYATTPITIGNPKVATAPVVTSAVAGNGQVVLKWSAPTDNGSANVTRYVVIAYLAGVAQPARTFNTATTQTESGLTNGGSYQFTVSAGNAAGNSPASAKSAVVVVGAPPAPTSVSATPGSGQATVSWTAPASNNGKPITGYVVTPYVGTVAQPAVTVGVVTTKVVTGLAHAKTYTFRVAAKNANGTGVPSVASNAARPNTVPIATADSYTTDEDIPFDVAAPGLLGNDTDADHDPLQIEIVSYPAGGIDVQADGSFSYEPYMDRDSDDSFVYRVSDGITWSAPVVVTIDIIAVNDPPIVEGEQYETPFETTLDVGSPGVLANDYDPVEFDGLTASGPLSGPSHGTLVLRSDGSFTYTPDPGYSGFDSFSYLVSDSQPGGTATAEITVLDPDPPVAG